jgi:hypothetical protein
MDGEPQIFFANVSGHGVNEHGLRARRKEPVRFDGDCISELHPELANGHDSKKEKKTFGRTPDGTGKCFNTLYSGPFQSLYVMDL